MKSLKESLFDDDLVTKEIDGPINSFYEVQKLILDPIADSLGINVFYKKTTDGLVLCTTKPQKFMNIIESPLSYSGAATYNISMCYKLTQKKKKKYGKDIIRIFIQIRGETLESDKSLVFKLDNASIFDGENRCLNHDWCWYLNRNNKNIPKVLKNIFNNDHNKYTVTYDYGYNETADIIGVITFKNYEDIKNYFIDFFKKYFELIEMYDNSNMSEFVFVHKLKNLSK